MGESDGHHVQIQGQSPGGQTGGCLGEQAHALLDTSSPGESDRLGGSLCLCRVWQHSSQLERLNHNANELPKRDSDASAASGKPLWH
jgi:hypothetical protein